MNNKMNFIVSAMLATSIMTGHASSVLEHFKRKVPAEAPKVDNQVSNPPGEVVNPAPTETVVVTPSTPGQPKVVETVETKTGETIKVQDVPSKNAGDYVVKFGSTKYPFIEEAAKVANCYLTKGKLKDKIAAHPKYNYTSHVSLVVADKLFKKTPVIVRTYCKKLTKTLGYRVQDTNEFYVNICKRFELSADLVNTLFHERAHVVGFGHDGNTNNEFNRGTVPYKTGEFSESFFKECLSENKTK